MEENKTISAASSAASSAATSLIVIIIKDTMETIYIIHGADSYIDLRLKSEIKSRINYYFTVIHRLRIKVVADY